MREGGVRLPGDLVGKADPTPPTAAGDLFAFTGVGRQAAEGAVLYVHVLITKATVGRGQVCLDNMVDTPIAWDSTPMGVRLELEFSPALRHRSRNAAH
jgi:hypothetical protein